MAIITGDGTSETLNGGAEADSISGMGGDDTINAGTRPTAPGSGGDVVDGGAGTDVLVVDASSETGTVQLFVGGSPRYLVRSVSSNFYVDAYTVERVQFTGGSGDDHINTDNGGLTVDGGGGIDHWLADLSALTSNVNFRLGTTTAIAAAGLTSILGIERITLTTGTGNDSIIGGAQGDSITTGAGNDTIDAGRRPTASGSPGDAVFGGDDIDTLVVNASTETQTVQLFVGGSPRYLVRSVSGNFYVDAYAMEKVKFTGGSGDDHINTDNSGITVDGNGGIDHWLADLGALTTDVNFTLGTTTAIAAAGLTSIRRIERITLTTGTGDDSIIGGAQGDSLTTGAGNDTIDAGKRPTASGSPGDVVFGGDDIDTLVVNAATETQTVQLFVGGSPRYLVRSVSGNFYVDAYAVEKVKFTGGSADDHINTDNGGLTVDGNGGIDHWLADMGALSTNVRFTLGTTTAIAAAGLTSITDIERISLTTGSGNDVITGGVQGDTILTGAGNDKVDAGKRPSASGSPGDFVDGGIGTDVLIVNASAETQGLQLFAGGSPSFQVRSVSGNFFVDAFNIEKVRFTGGQGNDLAFGDAAADLITTNAGNDSLTGGGGNDTLQGGANDDLIRGGSGADKLTGGGGRDTFDFDAVSESNAATAIVDRVADFTTNIDEFDLSSIDANGAATGDAAFIFIGSAAFGGVRGQLRSVAGRLDGDVNGDSIADFRVILDNGVVAGVGDIIL